MATGCSATTLQATDDAGHLTALRYVAGFLAAELTPATYRICTETPSVPVVNQACIDVVLTAERIVELDYSASVTVAGTYCSLSTP